MVAIKVGLAVADELLPSSDVKESVVLNTTGLLLEDWAIEEGEVGEELLTSYVVESDAQLVVCRCGVLLGDSAEVEVMDEETELVSVILVLFFGRESGGGDTDSENLL